MFPGSTGQSDLYTTAIFPGTQGWVEEFVHLPAALPSGLPRKVFISPTQRRKKAAWHLSMGSGPWQWNPTETEDQHQSLQQLQGTAFGLALPDLNTQQCTHILLKGFKAKHSLSRCTGEEDKKTSRSQMFASFLHEWRKGAELCSVSPCVYWSYMRCHRVPLPNAITAACEHWTSFALNGTALYGFTKKNFLGFKSLAHSLDCGKSWGINVVEKLWKGTYVKHCTNTRGLLPHHPSLLKDNLVICIPCFCAQQCFLVSNSSVELQLLALCWLRGEILHFLKEYFWFELSIISRHTKSKKWN